MRFRKVGPCIYEINSTGYMVEKMATGEWDAYLPNAMGWRLWSSPAHSTRRGATQAALAEHRRIARAVHDALNKEAR